MTMNEYREAVMERQSVARINASRRMRDPNLPLLPMPPKPVHPTALVAYERDGTYAGVIRDPDECPPGCHVKQELAIR